MWSFSKLNIARTGLFMTCCIRESNSSHEILLTKTWPVTFWRMNHVSSDATRQLSSYFPLSSHDVPWLSAELFGDDVWSPGALEWDGSFTFSHSTVSAEAKIIPPVLSWNVNWARLWGRICFTVFNALSFVKACVSNTMTFTDSFNVITPLCTNAYDIFRKIHETCYFKITHLESSTDWIEPSIKILHFGRLYHHK